MVSYSFKEYIKFLRENLGNLIEYKECIGIYEPDLSQVNDDLFNKDPFVVFLASVKATKIFADKKIYH